MEIVQIECKDPIDIIIQHAGRMKENNHKVLQLIEESDCVKFNKVRDSIATLKFAMTDADIIWGYNLACELKYRGQEWYDMYEKMFKLEFDEFDNLTLYEYIKGEDRK